MKQFKSKLFVILLYRIITWYKDKRLMPYAMTMWIDDDTSEFVAEVYYEKIVKNPKKD